MDNRTKRERTARFGLSSALAATRAALAGCGDRRLSGRMARGD